jgi:rare lipoprotein A
VRLSRALIAFAFLCLTGCAAQRSAEPTPAEVAPQSAAPQPGAPRATESLPAPSQTGNATYYANSLKNRKMADGSRFDPSSDSAASKTLPLGSKAEITNLKNGKTAIVTIRDRGPHVKGAIVDVSPKTADNLDMKRDGKARVTVRPLAEKGESDQTPLAER